MWIWLGSILILLLLMLMLLFMILMSKITFTLTVKKINRDETILLDVKLLFGLLSFHYRIPVIKLKNLKEGLVLKNDRSDNMFANHTADGEQKVNKDIVNRWMDELLVILKATSNMKLWLKRTLRRVSLLHLEWSTNIALPDAAHTATLAGALWPLKTTLIGMLSYNLSLKQRPKLFVVPVFGSPPLFATEFKCVAEIRCGSALYAGFILVYRVLKVKGGAKKLLGLIKKNKKEQERRNDFDDGNVHTPTQNAHNTESTDET